MNAPHEIPPQRATLADIARQAGVSTATVDRVLNDRAGVRNRTRELVLETAQRLGYLEPVSDTHDYRPARTLDFVLPAGNNTFIRHFAAHLQHISANRPGTYVRLHHIEGFDPEALSRALNRLEGHSAAVGVVALDHPLVREALRSLIASGTRVVTLMSDISNVAHEGYIGVDNRAAGRLSGYLLGRLLPKDAAKVALFAGSLSYRGHEEREMGFRHILRDDYPHLSVVEMREVRDDTERAYNEARAILHQHPDLSGIYNIGAGNRGIARAIEESGRKNEIIFIGHELTEHTRRFLLNGVMDVVIDQNPRVEAREAIDRLLHLLQDNKTAPQTPVRVQAIFKENIPE
ncbi:MAG: LacI family DNA-binding transcriptional regulator [Asticcacaulis sp.]